MTLVVISRQTERVAGVLSAGVHRHMHRRDVRVHARTSPSSHRSDTVVLPISVDSTASLQRVQGEVPDAVRLAERFPARRVAAYGVFNEEKFYANRAYFVIDRQGVVRWAWQETQNGQRRENAELLGATGAARVASGSPCPCRARDTLPGVSIRDRSCCRLPAARPVSCRFQDLTPGRSRRDEAAVQARGDSVLSGASAARCRRARARGDARGDRARRPSAAGVLVPCAR